MLIKRSFSDSLLLKADELRHHDLKLIMLAFLASPLVLTLILQVLSVSFASKFCLLTMYAALMAVAYSGWVFTWIMAKDTGTQEMEQVAKSIEEGAEGYFSAQSDAIKKLSGVFALAIFVIYIVRTPKQNAIVSPTTEALLASFSFLLGAICSGVSGYAGMWVSIRANIRVAAAARKCYNEAIQIAFAGGYFAAALNVALAMLGIGLLVFMLLFSLNFTKTSNLKTDPLEQIPLLIIGFGFGASFVAMFSQLGGGIYTKAADIGADIIGKVEAGLPEDDVRNPAVIADLVGDNVGDCAGQAADLFESISAEVLSAMVLGATLASEVGLSASEQVSFTMFPLAVHTVDLIASTAGFLMVKTKPGLPDYDAGYGKLEDPLAVMKRGYRVTLCVGIPLFVLICYSFLGEHWINFMGCGLIGTALAYSFVELTQYYTDYHHGPVKKIVASSKTGAATNIISGLAVGLESTGPSLLLIVTAMTGAFYLGELTGLAAHKGDSLGGLFGTALATMGMFTSAVYVLSMSGFGPIADNAGGIAQLSGECESVRETIDILDAVGNVTKANTKGYSVASAGMACFLLFSAFVDEINFLSPSNPLKSIDLSIPEIFIAGMLGSGTVFLFAGWAIDAVSKAAQDVINEIRTQISEMPGILEGTTLPDYKKCVNIVAKAGIREMIRPGLLAIITPVTVGITFRMLGSLECRQMPLLGAQAAASYLMFASATGILMALFLNNAGGAWDNAKKFIETGALGGKSSESHKAAVIGDTVGDPFKDTAGPSIHILMKLLSTITLVLAPLFV